MSIGASEFEIKNHVLRELSKRFSDELTLETIAELIAAAINKNNEVLGKEFDKLRQELKK